MGTRHLIAVHVDGQYKVAQYGQWDGYPDGQGTDVLAFLRTMERAQFIEKVRAAQFADMAHLEALGDQWLKVYPHMSRDTGSDILQIVANAAPGITLRNSIEFAADGLFCEWAYVIDLDKETFEVFKGFNKEPLAEGERFYGATCKDEYTDKSYTPVRLVKSYSLAALPSDEAFLADLCPKDEDEEA